MATNFPASQDNFTNPTSGSSLSSPSHSQQHSDVNDAVEAIEGALLDGAPLHIDDANERVGIGTTSPAVQLQLAGTDDREALRLSGDGGSSGNQGSVFMGFHHWATGTHPSARIGVIETDDANYDASLVFQTRSSGADVVPSTRMTINESGNVGINDTTPSYALDVNGDINAQGYARSKGKKLGMALLHEDSLSGGVSTFQNQFNADYNNYRIVIDAAQNGNTTWTYFRFVNSSNTAISSGYYTAYFLDGTFGRQNSQSAAVAMRSGYDAYGGMVMDITLPYTGDNPSFHISSAGHDPSNTNVDSLWVHGYCVTSLDITGIQFYNGTPYGSVKVYGY